MSVVMPIYHKVRPEQFHRAVESLRTQTWPADEIVIVCDGPIDPDIDSYLRSKAASDLTVVRLAENQGTAVGMQAGFDIARNRWVARQDADDVSLPDRFEKQWPLVATGEYAAVGGQMLEFERSPEDIVRSRTLPSEPEEIARYARRNSPINNPTAICDRDAVVEVGGVHKVHLMEDYDLWARLISAGYRLVAVDEPVVFFQADDGMFKRRTGREMARAELVMQRNLVRYGMVSRSRAVVNFILRQGFRMLPQPLVRRVYAVLFDRAHRQIECNG